MQLRGKGTENAYSPRSLADQGRQQHILSDTLGARQLSCIQSVMAKLLDRKMQEKRLKQQLTELIPKSVSQHLYQRHYV